METPKNSHWEVGKTILRYIVGTINFGIMYSTKNYGSQVGYLKLDTLTLILQEVLMIERALQVMHFILDHF